jgi:2-polyprenyl-3-methyl-5-hydroxy-6-metoxy-1,4-benzoquinol methylase
MAPEPWAVALFRRSVLKQRKLAEITALLGPTEGRRCLDLGSDNGVVSLMLRRRGGRWASADMTEEAVASIRGLVASDVHLASGDRLPFPDGEFDCVAVVDMLEHVADERAFVAELARVTRPGGRLVVNTPHARATALRRIRDRIGLTDEKHGHVRPGYTAEELKNLLDRSGKFSWDGSHTYSRAFSEVVDLAINWSVARLGKGHSTKGMVVTGHDVLRHRHAFRAYAVVYPAVRAFSSLDRLIPFVPGYMLIAAANRLGS